jgi:hypothetical protein
MSSSNPETALLRAQSWLAIEPENIEDMKEKLKDAIGLFDPVTIIEYRDQINQILTEGNAIVQSLEGTHTPVIEQGLHHRPPTILESLEIKLKRESSEPHGNTDQRDDPLHRVKIIIGITGKWLRTNLPNEYTEGFGDDPGDIGNPMPSTPYPRSPGGRMHTSPSPPLKDPLLPSFEPLELLPIDCSE